LRTMMRMKKLRMTRQLSPEIRGLHSSTSQLNLSRF